MEEFIVRYSEATGTPEVKVGVVEKTPDGVFLSATESIAEMLGFEGGIYHPEMRATNASIPIYRSIVDSINASDREVMRTGNSYASETWARSEHDGLWKHNIVLKSRTEHDTLKCKIFTSSGDLTTTRWLDRLDFYQERVRLPDGSFLTRREIELLRMTALGYRQRLMAERLFVSVKTIEKYLARLREQITGLCGCSNATLLSSMSSIGLTQFVLTHHDWFSTESKIAAQTFSKS